MCLQSNDNVESEKQSNDGQNDILLSSPGEKKLGSSFSQEQNVLTTERKGSGVDSSLSVQNDKKRVFRTKVKSPSVNYDGNKSNVIWKCVRNHRGISINALVKEHAEALVILKETERESLGKGMFEGCFQSFQSLENLSQYNHLPFATFSYLLKYIFVC